MASNVYIKIGRKPLFPGSLLLARSMWRSSALTSFSAPRDGGRRFYIHAFRDPLSRVPGMVLNEACSFGIIMNSCFFILKSAPV